MNYHANAPVQKNKERKKNLNKLLDILATDRQR